MPLHQRSRKLKIIVIGFAALTLVLYLVGLSPIGIPAVAHQRTETAFDAAKFFLDSESARLANVLPNAGEKILKAGSSGLAWRDHAGGRADIYLEEIDATHEDFDVALANYRFQQAGRVVFVVDCSLNPVIKIHHTDTPAARDIASRMFAALDTNFNAKIVSTSFTPRNFEFTNSPEKWIQTLKDVSVAIAFWASCCLLLIILVLIGDYALERKRRRSGVYCTSCGYDLRGTPSHRCSECGTIQQGL